MYLPRTLIDWSRGLKIARNIEILLKRFTTLLVRGVNFFNDFHAHFITPLKFSFFTGFYIVRLRKFVCVQTVHRLLFQSMPSWMQCDRFKIVESARLWQTICQNLPIQFLNFISTEQVLLLYKQWQLCGCGFIDTRPKLPE